MIEGYNKNELFNNFSQAVKENNYTKIPYKLWRKLINIDSQNLTIEFNICSRKIKIINCNESFDIYDNSLGSFIYQEIFKQPSRQEKITMSNYDTVTTSNIPYNGIDTTNTIHYYDTNSWNPSISSNTYTYTAPSLVNENDVRRICKEVINENKEKNNKMNTNNMFNFDFGPVSNSQFRMSPYGIAVHTQTNGWVAYDKTTGNLMDVDVVNFDISKMIYKMPVALTAVKPGDILMHGNKPVFVCDVATKGDNTARVINYTNATVEDILPIKSPFGFNFFTKICTLFNFDQIDANADNPFGSMLPFLMLNGEKDGNFDPTLLFMASSFVNGNTDFASNPMMMYFLMNREDKNDILPFLMMINGGNFMTPAAQK